MVQKHTVCSTVRAIPKLLIVDVFISLATFDLLKENGPKNTNSLFINSESHPQTLNCHFPPTFDLLATGVAHNLFWFTQHFKDKTCMEADSVSFSSFKIDIKLSG